MKSKLCSGKSRIARDSVSPADSGASSNKQRDGCNTGAKVECILVNLGGAHSATTPAAAGAVRLHTVVGDCAVPNNKTAATGSIGKRQVTVCCSGECVVFEEEGICRA